MMISEILKILPGHNCGGYGGCGFDTCRQCAERIFATKQANMCPACSQEQINTIAQALGTQTMEASADVAFIKCKGNAAGKSRITGIASCAEFVRIGFNYGECKDGCVGIGSCVNVCEFDAMTIDDNHCVNIDRDKCTGCKACQNICPQKLIQMVPIDATIFIPCSSELGEDNTRTICGYGCIGCGECEDTCPVQAVKVVNNHAVIDYDLCAGCMACTVKCRKKIIIDEFHDITKLKENVAFVRCNGGNKAKTRFDALGIEDCNNAVKLDAGLMGLCKEGCTGLGNCIKVCRYDAIHIVNGTAAVDFEKCVGCLDCVGACPKNLIVEVPYVGSKIVACASKAPRDRRDIVCHNGCIDCTDCVNNCPNGAIRTMESHAVVDGNICENCGVCTYMCSRNVIKRMDVPEFNYLQKNAMKIKEEE